MLKKILLVITLFIPITHYANAAPDNNGALKDENGFSCDCDYRSKGVFKSGGCKIVYPAPQSTACYCKYQGFWTCDGSVTVCEDAEADACKNPSRNKASCQQGGGDCGGY